MKTISFLSLAIFFTASNFIINDNYETIKRHHFQIKESIEENIVEKREKIVFILGVDKVEDNQYYNLAKDYYRFNPKNKGALIIDTCLSLNSVKKFLNDNPPKNHLPWGKINLIVHSNEWTGISVPIFENGKRATYNLLSNAINTNRFEPIKTKFIDKNSNLEIKACGFGKNKKFVNLLGKAFGCSNVSASENFVMYEKIGNYPEQYEAKSYYGYFKTGYRPANLLLREQLSKKYPNEKIDWLSALSRKKPRFFGDAYHYYFNVPVKWTITFATKSERPIFKSENEKITWLKAQTDLIKSIEKTKIPFDKFRWQLKYKNYTFEDGITDPAIEINGKSSVLCVLKAITE